ncbi:hypothetical protein TNCV_4141321 [Trichonephila clavipes]|nr:hypothetical protein TNCV_4141321 [Trichonephila clavipes]
MRAFVDGPGHFKPWPRDDDDTKLAPPLLTTPPHQREDGSSRGNRHRECGPVLPILSNTFCYSMEQNLLDTLRRNLGAAVERSRKTVPRILQCDGKSMALTPSSKTTVTKCDAN